MLAQVDAELPPTNNQVPEPSTIILMLTGLLALVSFIRKPG
jgi:hypothetical protein